MILDEKQLKEIAKIIDSHVGVLLYAMNGGAQPSKELLKKLGIPENAPSFVKNSFILGKIAQMMGDEETKDLTYEELKRKAREYSLSKLERNSIRYAEHHAAQYVTALGHKMSKTVNTNVARASKAADLKIVQRNMIKDAVKQAILNTETRGKLASELYHELEDWNRDWKRVANTELWNARLSGEVTSILQGDTIHQNTDGGETMVFRRPAPDACKHCQRLYLEDDGVTPKIFKLSELIANGDNYGRKTADWKPTTATTHPNCTCPIAVVPDGFGFDSHGNLEFME